MNSKSIQFFLLFIFGFVFSQTQAELKQKKSIDEYSNAMGKDKNLVKYTFIVKGKDKKILYTYEKKNNEIVKISRKWDMKNEDYIDTFTYYFLMENEKKIYASESIFYHKNNDENDMGGWSVQFWLKDDKVIYMTSNGHGKTESDDWDYEKELKENFEYMLKTVKNYDKKRLFKELHEK